MAVIADDSPAKEKVSPAADIPVIANESPGQDEGFSTDDSKKYFEPSDIDQDSEEKPLPPPEVTTEAPGLLPAQKKRKKRRQRKRRSKKIKAVVTIRGPRTKHGIFSGKFHLKLPKKAIGNRLLIIALCSFLQYQLAHCALHCMTSVPVSDVPVVLQHRDQSVMLQNRPFCPERRHMFGSCTACFREIFLLEIVCSEAVTINVWAQHGDGRGDEILVRRTSGDLCLTPDGNHFMKKSHQQRVKTSEQWSPDAHPKAVKKSSVEEKEDKGTPMKNNNDMCSIYVTVTESPIFILQDGLSFPVNEPMFCPVRAELRRSCAACFKNQSLLEVSCRKPGDDDYGPLWVEHGKGNGLSSLVDMNSTECHKIVNNASKSQDEQSVGEMSTEDAEAGSKGTSWRDSGLFVIPIIFSVAFSSGFA